MPYYLGMYDVSCNQLRAKIFRLLIAYGIHRQRSVFECQLLADTKQQLLDQLYLLCQQHEHNILLLQIYPNHPQSVRFGLAKHAVSSSCLYIG